MDPPERLPNGRKRIEQSPDLAWQRGQEPEWADDDKAIHVGHIFLEALL